MRASPSKDKATLGTVFIESAQICSCLGVYIGVYNGYQRTGMPAQEFDIREGSRYRDSKSGCRCRAPRRVDLPNEPPQ